MALPLTQTAEGGTNGTFATTANTGGASGDAFTAVSPSASADPQPKFASAQAHGGSLSLAITQPASPAVAYLEYGTTPIGGNKTTLGGRIYLYLTAAPSSAMTVVRFLAAGTSIAAGIRIDVARTIRCLASTSGTTAVGSASTALVPLNAWCRIDWDVVFSNAGAGTINARLFSGANLETTTPDTGGSLTNTSISTSTFAAANTVRIGCPAGNLATGQTLYVDDYLLQLSGFGGPAVVANALAGTIASASTAAGALSVRAPLAAAVASASTLAGAVTVTSPLAGVVASATTVAGSVTVTRPLAGTVAAASTLAGSVTVTRDLAGPITSSSTVAGALTASADLAGTVASSSTLSGSLTVTVPLAGTVTSASVLTGTLTNDAAGVNALAGTIAGASTLTGALTVGTPLAGSVVAVSTLSGALLVTADLNATVSSTSVLNGSLTVGGPLAGGIAATSTVAGAIVVYRDLAGSIVAASSLTATLMNTAPAIAVGWLESSAAASSAESGVATRSSGEGAAAVSVVESSSGVLALIE